MSISRRGFLGALAGSAAVGALGGASIAAASQPPASSSSYPFDGPHQAGIRTPQQARLHFAAFDVITTDRDRLRALLAAWTAAARALTQGDALGARGVASGEAAAPPDDTGEVADLPASGLTLTLGLGPSLFDDRFGLADARPEALVELPHFASDNLDPARSNGDLCLVACADDEQVALHAVRNLARLGAGVVAIKYLQQGQLSARSGATPRNLMGFKDGTANAVQDDDVWVTDGPAWLDGGSYLVTRRIRMTIETWDRTSLGEQEAIFGRTKLVGGPLSGGGEFTEPDFASNAIAPDAHVRLAHPTNNAGAQILRRGYNYADGLDVAGHLDAGLFFMAYQRDPRTGFLPIQRRLAASDRLNEYIRHVGSGLWAVPPGSSIARPWAAELFA